MMQPRAHQSSWAGGAQSSPVSTAEFLDTVELGVATAIGWLLVAIVISGLLKKEMKLFP